LRTSHIVIHFVHPTHREDATMGRNESMPRDDLEAVAEEVVDIARTWVETGFTLALEAVGAAADALRSTGEHLAQMGARMGDGLLPDDIAGEPGSEIDDEPGPPER
jgi:hypothetical protein